MSNAFYGNKPIHEVSQYYGVSDRRCKWLMKDCETIQQGFINHGIILTLRECEDLYRIYSDEYFCASWENMDGFSSEDMFEILKPVLDKVIVDRITRLETIIKQIEQYDDNKVESDEFTIQEVVDNA